MTRYFDTSEISQVDTFMEPQSFKTAERKENVRYKTISAVSRSYVEAILGDELLRCQGTGSKWTIA